MTDFFNKYNDNSSKSFSLAGKFLVASPHAGFEDMFDKSIIYVVSHSNRGAIGVVVNKFVNNLSCATIFKIFKEKISLKDEDIKMPTFLGGPNEPEKGFILHSSDYTKNSLLVNNKLAISSNIEIIKDITNNSGPKDSIFIVGYTGWGAGQLEEEINNNCWIISEPNKQLIFSEVENKWEKAIISIGLDPKNIMPEIGHC